jgi:hypothetical protein
MTDREAEGERARGILFEEGEKEEEGERGIKERERTIMKKEEGKRDEERGRKRGREKETETYKRANINSIVSTLLVFVVNN